jgi:hypothetical protein
MRKLLLLISVISFASCEEKPVCLKCEKSGYPNYEFCDGDNGIDATLAAYNLTNEGYYCTKQ